MIRCEICGALNADHAEHCEKCNVKLSTKHLNDNGLKDDYKESNNFGMIVGFFSIVMGLVFLIVEFIEGSFSIVGLFYILLGVALITVINKSLKDTEHIKSLEIEVSSLKKQISAIKDELNKK